MEYNIKIFDKTYQIIDALEYITLADSFVKNKMGTGHGEAKLYVGNASEKLFGFFESFEMDCFFCKKDFSKYLQDAEQEFLFPQQNYVKKKEMKQYYSNLTNKLTSFNKEILNFKIYKVNVKPPRVYINSTSSFYEYIRDVGLPNISYLSILKIIDNKGKQFLYFKIFIDYKSDIVKYLMPEEIKQEGDIQENKNLSAKKKESLIQARIGQGEYRSKLLEECPFCPFTMVNDERLLIASHIKPWSKSDDKEKIDPKNGFMFTPTYDKLFDKGFITFDVDGLLIVSPWLSPMNQKRLGIYTGKKIPNLPLDGKRLKYLEYHIKNIFKG